jgi:hypothetical protein
MRPQVVVAVWASLHLCCVVDRPIVDDETDRSPTTKLFAADCRAWVRNSGEVESQVLLIDFAEGQGELRIRWSIDGVEEPVLHESRPRIVREGGRFLKYSLKRSIVRKLPPGEHTIAATIENPPRVASCVASILAP